MRRIRPLLAVGGITAIAVTAPLALAATGTPKVSLTNTAAKGMILTNKGYTLFMFSRDKANKDNCVKIKGCTSIWPVLKTKGKPIAGSGVNQSLLGTIKLPNGKKQVTYNKHPLYFYSGDSGPGQQAGQGLNAFGAKWYVVAPAGGAVT
jgi:predicted lipoprotein with Yx(FWY)xxD motif